MTFIPKQFLKNDVIHTLVIRRGQSSTLNIALLKNDVNELLPIENERQAEKLVLGTEFDKQVSLTEEELTGTWKPKLNWMKRLLVTLNILKLPHRPHPCTKLIVAANAIAQQTRRGKGNILIYNPVNSLVVSNVLDGTLPSELGFTKLRQESPVALALG